MVCACRQSSHRLARELSRRAPGASQRGAGCRWMRKLLPVALAVLILAVSHLPQGAMRPTGLHYRVEHALAYGLLACACLFALRKQRALIRVPAALAITMAVGAVDELTQPWFRRVEPFGDVGQDDLVPLVLGRRVVEGRGDGREPVGRQAHRRDHGADHHHHIDDHQLARGEREAFRNRPQRAVDEEDQHEEQEDGGRRAEIQVHVARVHHVRGIGGADADDGAQEGADDEGARRGPARHAGGDACQPLLLVAFRGHLATPPSLAAAES